MSYLWRVSLSEPGRDSIWSEALGEARTAEEACRKALASERPTKLRVVRVEQIGRAQFGVVGAKRGGG